MRADGIKRKKLRGLYKMLSIEKNLDNFFYFCFFFTVLKAWAVFPLAMDFILLLQACFKNTCEIHRIVTDCNSCVLPIILIACSKYYNDKIKSEMYDWRDLFLNESQTTVTEIK